MEWASCTPDSSLCTNYLAASFGTCTRSRCRTRPTANRGSPELQQCPLQPLRSAIQALMRLQVVCADASHLFKMASPDRKRGKGGGGALKFSPPPSASRVFLAFPIERLLGCCDLWEATCTTDARFVPWGWDAIIRLAIPRSMFARVSPPSQRPRRPAGEVLHDLACALARQMAREDYAAEQAKERATVCESPSTPDSARTSRTSDR